MTEHAHIQLGSYLIAGASRLTGTGHTELALRTDTKNLDVCVLRRLPGTIDSDEREERVRREMQIAVRLEHENIARTLRVEKIDGVLCVAQEHVEGVSLAKLMRQLGARPLPFGLAVHLVCEMARALAYAHGFGRQGIVHRDVTPENVMLSFDGEVKLVNFGIARSALDDAATNLGIVVGRHSYVPPEAWEGGELDSRADLFALGVVLWEVLTGRRAEEEAEPTLADPRELNPEVPPLLAQILERATAPAPENRYPSADELGAALAAFVPVGSDPRQELRDLLASCFDVALQRKRMADDLAEAEQFLRGAGPPAPSASSKTFVAPWPAPPTAVQVAPATTGRRGRSAGPWVAAAMAAIVATSGIGLLRTHGRTTRSRASAEPLFPVAPQASESLAIAPPPAAAPPPPAAATGPRLAPQPAPRAAEAALALGERPEPPRRVAGRAPEGIDRPPLDPAAKDLLARANDLWERGNSAAAYDLARRAAATGAGAPAHVLLGTLLIGMRDYSTAATELETALRLDSRNAEARRMLALLRNTSAERQAR